MLSVGQVAERCGVATSAVRYYDAEGLISSTRTSGGQRRFGRDTIRRISFILAAQRVGRPLSEVRDTLEGLPANRTPNQKDWTRVSTAWRSRLDKQIEELSALRDQLDECIGCGCLSLDRCAIYNPEDKAVTLGKGARYLLGDSASDLIRD
jgi:MerR family redox-sensitive transcriptional activator SoxR